jgi:hypothetical protein
MKEFDIAGFLKSQFPNFGWRHLSWNFWIFTWLFSEFSIITELSFIINKIIKCIEVLVNLSLYQIFIDIEKLNNTQIESNDHISISWWIFYINRLNISN